MYKKIFGKMIKDFVKKINNNKKNQYTVRYKSNQQTRSIFYLPQI